MKTHELKLNIEFCDAVLNGEKTFEIRENDRGFQKGDHIKFLPIENGLSVRHAVSKKEYEITYVLSGWGLKDGYVAMAIREVKENEEKKMKCKYCIHNKICSTYVYVGDDGDICPYFAGKFQYIKLPCKVGDTLYVNRRCLYIPNQTRAIEPICECEVIAFKKNNRGISMLLKPIHTGCAVTRVSYQWFVISAIGETVFLDSKSAEKALKEREANEK